MTETRGLSQVRAEGPKEAERAMAGAPRARLESEGGSEFTNHRFYHQDAGLKASPWQATQT